jgi:hypothetical protein
LQTLCRVMIVHRESIGKWMRVDGDENRRWLNARYAARA